MDEHSSQQQTSEDTKTIVTVLLLIFVYPVGFIVMWAWPRWPWWVKLLVSLPVILLLAGLGIAFAFLLNRPAEKSEVLPTPTPVMEQPTATQPPVTPTISTSITPIPTKKR